MESVLCFVQLLRTTWQWTGAMPVLSHIVRNLKIAWCQWHCLGNCSMSWMVWTIPKFVVRIWQGWSGHQTMHYVSNCNRQSICCHVNIYSNIKPTYKLFSISRIQRTYNEHANFNLNKTYAQNLLLHFSLKTFTHSLSDHFEWFLYCGTCICMCRKSGESLYQLLGLQKGASHDEIKKAYRKVLAASLLQAIWTKTCMNLVPLGKNFHCIGHTRPWEVVCLGESKSLEFFI